MTVETLAQPCSSPVQGLNGMASHIASFTVSENGVISGGEATTPLTPQAAVEPPSKAELHHPVSSEAGDLSQRFRKLNLVDRFIDEPRRLRVVVIGAGLSGVIAGALLPAKVPGIELTIYDKNEEVVRRGHSHP